MIYSKSALLALLGVFTFGGEAASLQDRQGYQLPAPVVEEITEEVRADRKKRAEFRASLNGKGVSAPPAPDEGAVGSFCVFLRPSASSASASSSSAAAFASAAPVTGCSSFGEASTPVDEEISEEVLEDRAKRTSFWTQMDQGGKDNERNAKALSIKEQNQLKTVEILKEQRRPSGEGAVSEDMKKRTSLWENKAFNTQAFLKLQAKTGHIREGGNALTEEQAAKLVRDRRQGGDGVRDGFTKRLENHVEEDHD